MTTIVVVTVFGILFGVIALAGQIASEHARKNDPRALFWFSLKDYAALAVLGIIGVWIALMVLAVVVSAPRGLMRLIDNLN